ncbi:uncharacterized protein LOC129326224 [Eublepharis macularius]|uniref:Uncharacterized protein LOC129326224 n=1 Tax=Eublepharis macularius TaxID=481883 RepID=A0AA97J2W4_EUBMA|nr:uncharacterized protein LOC129326224 [Eublepharis macularius]
MCGSEFNKQSKVELETRERSSAKQMAKERDGGGTDGQTEATPHLPRSSVAFHSRGGGVPLLRSLASSKGSDRPHSRLKVASRGSRSCDTDPPSGSEAPRALRRLKLAALQLTAVPQGPVQRPSASAARQSPGKRRGGQRNWASFVFTGRQRRGGPDASPSFAIGALRRRATPGQRENRPTFRNTEKDKGGFLHSARQRLLQKHVRPASLVFLSAVSLCGCQDLPPFGLRAGQSGPGAEGCWSPNIQTVCDCLKSVGGTQLIKVKSLDTWLFGVYSVTYVVESQTKFPKINNMMPTQR